MDYHQARISRATRYWDYSQPPGHPVRGLLTLHCDLKVMAGNVPAEYPPIATRAGKPILRGLPKGTPPPKISYHGIGTTFCGPGLCLKIGSRRLLGLLFTTSIHHSTLFADSASGGTLTGSITRLLLSQFVRLLASGLAASGG